MASGYDWDKILQGKYKFYDIERNTYSANRKRANSVEMYAKYICENIQPGDVPDNLRFLYNEAVYGSDPRVKQRIIKRVYSIGNKVRLVESK